MLCNYLRGFPVKFLRCKKLFLERVSACIKSAVPNIVHMCRASEGITLVLNKTRLREIRYFMQVNNRW